MKPKRYLLFSGVGYYPLGGWSDYSRSFDAIEEAASAGAWYIDHGDTWWHVVDLETGEIVRQGDDTR